MFVSGEPLSLKQLASYSQLTEEAVLFLLKEIKADCERDHRGFVLDELAGGFLFTTRPEHSIYIERLIRPRLSVLTQAAMETLTIVAYRQPVTRPEIEQIRGVSSDSALNTLINRGLVEEKGRKEAPGRPVLYGTTQDFLKHFGLKTIGDLPDIKEPDSL